MSNTMQGAVIHDFRNQQLFFKEQAREVLIKGVDMVADLVTATIGPGGNTIVLENGTGDAAITKDGVTVAKNINPMSPFHVGANLVKRASKNIADLYGDGTSTVTLLTQKTIHIFDRIEKEQISEFNYDGFNKSVIFKYMNEYKEFIKDELEQQRVYPHKDNTIDVKDIIYTSSNGDMELTDYISQAYDIVGPDGLILVEESKSIHTQLQESLGYMWDKGFVTSQFLKDRSANHIKMEDVYYMIFNCKLERFEHIKPVLLKIAEQKKSLVIVADEYDNQVLEQLVANNFGGYLNIVAIKSPSFGESRTFNLEDMAAITNANLIGPTTSLNPWDIRMEDLGYSKSVIVKGDSIIMIEPEINTEAINQQVKQCQGILDIPQLSIWEKEQTLKRMARLTSKTITIQVGGYTDLEIKEQMDRYDDAIKALRVAIQSGVLPGGGLALYRISEKLERIFHKNKNLESNQNKAIALAIMAELCRIPLEKIMENCMINQESVDMLLKGNKKYYTIKDGQIKLFKNLKDTKCLDPFMVTYAGLDTSISLAISLLSSQGLVLTPYKIDMNDTELSPLQNGPLNF